MAKKKQHGGARPGSGRPVSSPEGKTIVMAASVPALLVIELDALSEEKGWSRSEAVTRAVRGLLASAKRGR
jgi:hypothetical protein